MSREALSFPAYMPFLLFSKEGIRVKLAFTKMHGCGNNYIYFNCFDQTVPDPESLSIKLSEPHFGIGGDGIILISPSDKADAQMRIFNADGSEGKMCGNGIRCVGKYLYDNGMTDGRTTITIDTLSGVKTLELTVKDGKMQSARVDMGAAILFPERVNTEFVNVLPDGSLKMRVWERGSGETWACGTGSCATGVAACLNGFANKNEDIVVHLRGGDLTIRYTDETVFMTGAATTVFKGEIEI